MTSHDVTLMNSRCVKMYSVVVGYGNVGHVRGCANFRTSGK